jgi:hypothetical protein
MRSKIRRRATPDAVPPPEPASSRSGPRASQVLVGLALLVVGGSLAISAERLVESNAGAGTKASAAAPSVAAPSVAIASSPPGSAAAAASSAPSAAPNPAAPVLEAELPRAVNGTTLTLQSATDAATLGNAPSARALSAAVTSLGRKPSDLEIAAAYDPSGALAASILGFRMPGLDPARLRTAILDAWLSINTPGVTSSSVGLSGTPSTRVSYGDSGPSEYVLVRGDSVFVVETADQTLAAGLVAAMPAASPTPSGG